MAAFFRVNKLSKTVVTAAAARPMHEHWLHQSNLDLLVPPLDSSVYFCYRKPPTESGHSFRSIVNVLKTSLSQTLVPYYALAGEMVTNAAGEPELLCNDRGVDFVEAYADVELRDLDLYRPDESIRGKLVPEKKNGVLSAQITQLKCGGVVVGCTFDHRIADAYSANMLWKSWAEMAQSKPISNLPSFRRSLLSSRRPGNYNPSVPQTYRTISKLPPPKNESEDEVLPFPLPGTISRIYSVSSEHIHNLQVKANHGPGSLISPATKVEAFSAFMWKLMATATNAGDGDSRLGMVVNGRSRLSGEDKLCSYFGNVLSVPFGENNNEELKMMSLNSIVYEIQKFLRPAITKEHFLGLIDFVEAHRPATVFAGIFLPDVNRKSPPTMVVSGGKGFPAEQMDFGWGLPVFGSYHMQQHPAQAGFVLPMPRLSGNGDWIVYLNLPKHHLDALENTASHIFKPLHLDL